ncbi:DEAD/DEAH box helicase [Polynucleobacter sp.]|uniref:DEAD/DEAH box helicase n=1 Tax=Polynucleobacter sp. TaxID=2029855 RepID=UPI0027365ED9|nr:DEAD/DEAH box helicase [Polynucleobacter sp.]MDP3122562.1 Helicase associated domain protein [Polynucleobacter sp.]
MPSFSNFLASLDNDSGRRGKEFEYFVKWFLKNDPEWATQVDEIWLWDEYPQNWGRDCGIDLVFKHKNGEIWAVQAKCYASTTSITKADIDSFISESNRPGIDKRLLIATTDLIGSNAKQVCDAQEKKVTRFLLSNFEKSGIEYPNSLNELATNKPRIKPTPDAHQLEAIEQVVTNLKNEERGQMIMACGTGKTFTTLWIKEKLKADSTLVLLPSLGLLSQTLHEWTKAANESFEVLCVCSDESVGKNGVDEITHSIADLAFPVTSNVEEIKSFIGKPGRKVVFSTYQSSPLIARAQLEKDVPFFDLSIADEAHRCAGKVSGDFSTILDSQKIRSKKRLFTTATPRTYSAIIKKGAEERGIDIIGMDDEQIFGKKLFTLSFGDAIKRKLLADYRVVILGINESTTATWIANRDLLKANDSLEMDAENLAAHIGLLKAIRDYDLRRIISFHSRVNRAENFSIDFLKVASWIDEKYRPSGDINSDFVSGAMPTDKRRRKLQQLKSLNDNERRLLTNARCLSEGVDVPSLDGVAFIDPRGSQIDIIQAVGRAIRTNRNAANEKIGTIILPVFIGNNEEPDQELENGNFKPIWDVLNALKAHDNVLADELNDFRVSLGKRNSNSPSITFNKIEFDLPISITQSFSDSIKTRLVENTTDSWPVWLDQTKQYVKNFNKIPIVTTIFNDFKIGAWVATQRNSYRSGSLNRDRICKLEEIEGWSWDQRDDIWSERFSLLQKFIQLNGHSNVPIRYREDGINLGNWASTQRVTYKEGGLSPDKIKKLESLPHWKWDFLSDKWNEFYEALIQLSQTTPPNSIKKGEVFKGLEIGSWLRNQRNSYKNGDLSEDRIKKLESIDGFTWKVIDAKWDKNFNLLQELVRATNDQSFPTPTAINESGLTNWILNQRSSYKKGTLSGERIQKLSKLNGWTWTSKADLWDEGFKELLKYLEVMQTAKVPSKFVTSGGYQLGAWTTKQRAQFKKGVLAEDRIQKLSLLPHWIWS